MNSSNKFYIIKPYFFIIFFALGLSFSQVRVGDWGALTSTLKMNDVEFIESTIFVATEC